MYVNDGSTDRSLELLQGIVADDHRVRVVDLSRNFGHQVALSAGVDHARGDAVVVIDSDLQDPPEVIPEMIERWRKGFKVVYGVRASRAGETRFKLLTSKVYYGLIDRISEVPLPRQAGDFRLLDREVVDVLARMPERNRYVRGMVAWVGFPQCAVEYERDPRYAGEHQVHVRGAWCASRLDGVTSFSDRPLRLATQLGLVVMVAGVRLRGVDDRGEHRRPRRHQSRLAVAHGGRAVPRRGAAALHRRARRVPRPGLPRDEGPTALRRRRRRRRRAPR